MESVSYPARESSRVTWYNFIHGNLRDHSDVRPEILKSWIRCSEQGVNPYTINQVRVGEEDLKARIAKNPELMHVGIPAIDFLYKFVKGAGFVVTLTDADAVVLYVVGDEETLRASLGYVDAGTIWSEGCVGTNSIGTAIAEDEPFQLFGFEHYSQISQRWAGSAAPIHSPGGTILGTVAISGELSSVHLHTLGMAVTTARSIEVQLALHEASGMLELRNQYQAAIINSISEGLMVVDTKNRISMVNNVMAAMLKADEDSIVGLRIESIIPDPEMLHTIQMKSQITDHITKLVYGPTQLSCTITSRRVMRSDGKTETVLVVNETVRVKKLALRLQGDEARLHFDDIVGSDIKLLSAVEIARTAAETAANVLILGESGTGKDVFAQAIHNGSSRKNRPYVAVNCGAIPRELIASTLFGYEEGAFTGARKGGNPGKFELADGGTIFLDEIGEIPLDIQTVLLRVLENKTFTRVGGKSTIYANVRVIAATNRNLPREVQMMRFRQDLFYRLNVLSIPLTPLRERKGDIGVLAEHFLQQMNTRYQRTIRRIAPDAIRLLEQYHWPGNIRELQNIVERSVILTKGGEITAQTLEPLMLGNVEILGGDQAVMLNKISRSKTDEKNELICLLDGCHWNISKAAAKLGVARSTLYRKIDRYHLKEYE